MKNTKLIMVLFVAVLYPNLSRAECPCPKQIADSYSQPETTFSFSNGKSIALCGFKEIDTITKKPIYSEYSLFECGTDSLVSGGNWFLQNSKLRKINDTLFNEDWPYFPTGNKFKEKETLWKTDKIYFNKGKLIIQKIINRKMKKYSENEIKSILIEFKKLNSGRAKPNDELMELIYKIFIAALSGSSEAKKSFAEVPNKIALDAIYGEQYNELQSKLNAWDSN